MAEEKMTAEEIKKVRGLKTDGQWVEKRIRFVNTSGKAGAQIPHLPLGDDSSPWGR
jgi:hypothetical protein